MITTNINSYEILQGSPELARLRRLSSGVGLQQKEKADPESTASQLRTRARLSAFQIRVRPGCLRCRNSGVFQPRKSYRLRHHRRIDLDLSVKPQDQVRLNRSWNNTTAQAEYSRISVNGRFQKILICKYTLLLILSTCCEMSQKIST